MNNFTPRAQQVLALARKEADRFNHNYVGTEHLLLGLIKLGQGVAVNVLQKMGLDLETVRMEVEKQVGSGPETKMVGNIPYTPRVKKVLALAGKEAKAGSEAPAAKLAKQADPLKTAQSTATSELKRLDDIAAKHRKAYDTAGETAILTTKAGPKIKQTVLALESLKQKAHVEFAKLPNK